MCPICLHRVNGCLFQRQIRRQYQKYYVEGKSVIELYKVVTPVQDS